MDVLHLAGSPRHVGRQYGEAYRDGFHVVYSQATEEAAAKPHWYDELALLAEVTRTQFPLFWDEMVGMSEGANLTMDELLLNQRSLLKAEATCTNIGFASTPDGPILGKNLDGGHPHNRQTIIRHIKYDAGQEIIHSTCVGDIRTHDTCMNGNGLAIGGSSVGSVFQKSMLNPSIEVGIYEALRNCSNVSEAIRFLQRRPWIGKGYNFVLVDAMGSLAVLECALPLVQVRRPADVSDVIFCANTFKLPFLAEADQRTPIGKENAERRYRYLEHKLFREAVPRSLGQMKSLLASNGPDGGLCRPLDSDDYAHTRMSAIVLPTKGEFWVADGRPCEVPFELMATCDGRVHNLNTASGML
jgi:predicted choloylglycine hydrolase